MQTKMTVTCRNSYSSCKDVAADLEAQKASESAKGCKEKGKETVERKAQL